MAKKKSKYSIDTSDNILTKKEIDLIQWYQVWAFVGPVIGIIIGIVIMILA
tara:strand:+ start:492 stop:644 length:153 start_codon:yes stop_codon:yes gene_type:complete